MDENALAHFSGRAPHVGAERTDLGVAGKDYDAPDWALAGQAGGKFAMGNPGGMSGEHGRHCESEKSIYTNVVRECAGHDMLIIYFSGHSFITGDRKNLEALHVDPESPHVAACHSINPAVPCGSQFLIELRQHFIGLAARRSRGDLPMTSGRRRGAEISGRSVNVYPEALMHDDYFGAVIAAIKHKLIPVEELIVDVSEKAQIPAPKRSSELGASFEQFRSMLEAYVASLPIGFAVDDFGIGYASAARIARLNLGNVESGQDGGRHEIGNVTIRYLLEIVGKQHSRSPNHGTKERAWKRGIGNQEAS